MNFKDAYKSYNDEIKSNPAVLKSVLQADIKPKFAFTYRPVLACAAMLAVLVSVSVFSYNTFYKEKEPMVTYIAATNVNENSDHSLKTTVPDNEITPNNAGDDKTDDGKNEPDGSVASHIYGNTAVNSAIVNDVETAAFSNVNRGSDETAYTKSNEPSGETMVITEINEVIPPVENPETSAYVEDDISDISLADNEDEVMVASLDVADDGAKAISVPSEQTPAMMSALSDEDFSTSHSEQYMSYGEYAEYTGLDIRAKAKLPDDMVFEPMPSAVVEYENDAVVSDTFSASAFSTENPDRNLKVSLSKSGNSDRSFTNEISYSYGDDSETVLGAHTETNGVSVRVDVNNVTKAELDTFINSLK